MNSCGAAWERVRKLTASIFLVTRALAEGVRVFAISLVISIVLGTGGIRIDRADRAARLHLEGGIAAVIWTGHHADDLSSPERLPAS